MKRICLFLLLPLFFPACQKNQASTDAITTDAITKCLLPGKTNDTDIIAKWELIASRVRFDVANPDAHWVAVNASDPKVTIQFSPDSVFSYSDNYAWKEQQYDRFKTIDKNEFNPDSVNFRIYATIRPTGNIGIYQSVTVKLLNQDGLLVSYMSTDISKQELYGR